MLVEVQHRLHDFGQSLEFRPAELVGLDDRAVLAAVVVVGVERAVAHCPAGLGRASSPRIARVAAAMRGRSGSRTMIVGSELVGSGTTADSLFERTFGPRSRYRSVTGAQDVPLRHRPPHYAAG